MVTLYLWVSLQTSSYLKVVSNKQNSVDLRSQNKLDQQSYIMIYFKS